MSKAKLPPRSLSSLFKQGKAFIYKSGEIIIRPDDPPLGIYYINKGFVKIYSITESGDEKLHVIYKPGEIFPLMWALKDIIHNDVYYEALSDVKSSRISRDAFKEFIQSNPHTLHEAIDRLVSHFNIFVDRVDNLEITKAYPRLVACLLSLANRFGKRSKKGVIIDIPIAQKDIANSINMSRETASREIEKLEKKDLITYKNHLIVIKNIKKLEGELSKHYERELI